MDNNNNNTTNIQELNEAIRIELDRQDSVIKQLSDKFGMTENVIRKRPVVRKEKNFTAFNMFVEDSKLRGKTEANKRNLENCYSEVKYIQNSDERISVLKDGLRELKYQCCRLNQECGWDFLVITIEPNVMPNSSFGFGSSLTNDFCIEQSDDILQLKIISKQQIDTENDKLESLISQTPSLNCQSSFTSESAIDNNDDIDSEYSTSSLSSMCMNSDEFDENLDMDSESSSTDSEDLDESFVTETDKETEDDDKTVCDDETDLADDPTYKLLSQDYMNVHLDNKLKSAVRKFLKARFCADTGKNINIPYKDWKKQTKYSISGWPENIKFEDWAKVKEKREVYRHLLDVHFHVNEEAPEFVRINKKRRKIA
ncbi:9202_t:CDS:2 [Rhizophagus irregularis]|nr:9202_t:CDS:2 [Rhizophagus irregularis]